MVVLYAPWCQFCKGLEPEFASFAEKATSPSLQVAKYQADIDRDYCETTFGLKTFPTIVFLPKNSNKVIRYTSDRRSEEALQMWANALAIRN